MSSRLPSPYRREFSTEGQFRNPAGTLPLPQPTNMPVGCWFGNRVSLPFQLNADPDFESDVWWASPIFDLHPELRGLQPSGSTGRSSNFDARTNGVNAVPIWGAGGNLYVQVSNLASMATALESVKVLTQEFGHVSDAGQIVQVQAISDISSQFIKETDSVILVFGAIGESTPVRYWQVRLHFVRVSTPAVPTLPVYYVDSAYY
jgi:hypothetical protein